MQVHTETNELPTSTCLGLGSGEDAPAPPEGKIRFREEHETMPFGSHLVVDMIRHLESGFLGGLS